MELPVSDRGSNFGIKPHIKKGYYPARLISVEQRKTKEGTLYEGTYGRQLIMRFVVCNPGDKGQPTEVLTHTENAENIKTSMPIILPKFVYYEYKDQKTNEYRTAITPNSAITKIFKALGWTFDASKPLNVNDFINKWAEINIDDYAYNDEDGQEKKASTIKDVGKYDSPTPSKSIENQINNLDGGNPVVVKKQLKHVDVKGESDKIQNTKDQILSLAKMKDEGNLSKEGFEQAKEQLEKQIKELEK